MNSVDYVWGVSSIRMNNADIVMDEYCPSSFGLDKPTGSYKTGTFVVPAGFDPKSNLPAAGTTCTVGGTFWWLNTPKIQATMPDNIFGFGFTGFQRPINATTISGQYLLAFTSWTKDSRTSKLLYGIKE